VNPIDRPFPPAAIGKEEMLFFRIIITLEYGKFEEG
jgi:hypothetical protein